MTVIGRNVLSAFLKKNPAATGDTGSWLTIVEKAEWETPYDLKTSFPKADILKAGRAVFNICHNRFRIVVRVQYDAQLLSIRWAGTHKKYDRIDADSI